MQPRRKQVGKRMGNSKTCTNKWGSYLLALKSACIRNENLLSRRSKGMVLSPSNPISNQSWRRLAKRSFAVPRYTECIQSCKHVPRVQPSTCAQADNFDVVARYVLSSMKVKCRGRSLLKSKYHIDGFDLFVEFSAIHDSHISLQL